jgi:type IV pilus secretin PilQ/predicted competence protein
MVKVGSMSRAKRILLIAGMLLIGASAEARLWGRKADKPVKAEALPSAIALRTVEVEGSRVILRTSGAPAYTSYSPSPGVFVVDLTGTSRDSSLAIPATLPPAVASISADDVTEMGSALTRVTFRLTDSLLPEVSAAENSVIITVPATAIAIQESAPAVDVLPAVVPVTASNEPAESSIEPLPEPAEIVSEPVARVEPVQETVRETVQEHATVETVRNSNAVLPRARAVKSIGAQSANGDVEVRIAADGTLKYKAFRLENPSRLVIDLDGVKNSATKNSITVDDDVVQRVRVAQFQPTVARVVIDLAQKSQYDIIEDGASLRVAFGGAPIVASKPAPIAVASAAIAEPAAPAPAPVKPAVVRTPVEKPATAKPIQIAESDDVASRVPTVVENAPSWKMPPPAQTASASKGARKVINAPADQAPPQQREDVFSDATAPDTSAAARTLSGNSRTLSSGARVFNGEPISLNLKDADIKDVLRTFAEITGLNIAIDPGVTGSVTVDFVDVPWDQALDLILRQNGLTYVLEGNVMRIGTLQRIREETEATAKIAENERLNVPLTTLSFKLSYARAEDVQTMLRAIASPRARIINDVRTNQLIISEIPEYLRTMQNLISTVDIPTRQVMIEARIVESARTFSKQWGVEWDFDGALDPATGTGTGLVFPNRIGYTGGPFNFASGREIFSVSLSDVLGTFNLDLALAAAEDEGFVKVISAPRVTTQDNQAASIQSGFQIPYQTRINFTTTVQYLDATLSLQVTPQITESGTVIMEISVQKNEPFTGLAIEGAAGTPLTTRQARTRLMVRDGGTAVIAGIYVTREDAGQAGVPVLKDIPVVGALFRTHSVTTSHDELLIFITPRIVRG